MAKMPEQDSRRVRGEGDSGPGGVIAENLCDSVQYAYRIEHRSRSYEFFESIPSDLNLIGKDGTVEVHRCLFMNASPLFRELLIDKSVDDVKAISIPDIHYRHLMQVRDLMYSGITVITIRDEEPLDKLMAILDLHFRVHVEEQGRQADKINMESVMNLREEYGGINDIKNECDNESEDGEMEASRTKQDDVVSMQVDDTNENETASASTSLIMDSTRIQDITRSTGDSDKSTNDATAAENPSCSKVKTKKTWYPDNDNRNRGRKRRYDTSIESDKDENTVFVTGRSSPSLKEQKVFLGRTDEGLKFYRIIDESEEASLPVRYSILDPDDKTGENLQHVYNPQGSEDQDACESFQLPSTKFAMKNPGKENEKQNLYTSGTASLVNAKPDGKSKLTMTPVPSNASKQHSETAGVQGVADEKLEQEKTSISMITEITRETFGRGDEKGNPIPIQSGINVKSVKENVESITSIPSNASKQKPKTAGVLIIADKMVEQEKPTTEVTKNKSGNGSKNRNLTPCMTSKPKVKSVKENRETMMPLLEQKSKSQASEVVMGKTYEQEKSRTLLATEVPRKGIEKQNLKPKVKAKITPLTTSSDEKSYHGVPGVKRKKCEQEKDKPALKSRTPVTTELPMKENEKQNLKQKIKTKTMPVTSFSDQTSNPGFSEIHPKKYEQEKDKSVSNSRPPVAPEVPRRENEKQNVKPKGKATMMMPVPSYSVQESNHDVPKIKRKKWEQEKEKFSLSSPPAPVNTEVPRKDIEKQILKAKVKAKTTPLTTSSDKKFYDEVPERKRKKYEYEKDKSALNSRAPVATEVHRKKENEKQILKPKSKATITPLPTFSDQKSNHGFPEVKRRKSEEEKEKWASYSNPSMAAELPVKEIKKQNSKPQDKPSFSVEKSNHAGPEFKRKKLKLGHDKSNQVTSMSPLLETTEVTRKGLDTGIKEPGSPFLVPPPPVKRKPKGSSGSTKNGINASGEVVVKRGRGRPRKYPLPTSTSQSLPTYNAPGLPLPQLQSAPLSLLSKPDPVCKYFGKKIINGKSFNFFGVMEADGGNVQNGKGVLIPDSQGNSLPPNVFLENLLGHSGSILRK